MNRRGAQKIDGEIGNRIRLLRIERDMSQEELGDYLKVSFQQVQKYEKGVNRVSAGRLAEIAKVLKSTPHDLIGWDTKFVAVPMDVETYKLARAFIGLPDQLKGPVRLLINGLMRNE